jgi:hypothetical protein
MSSQVPHAGQINVELPKTFKDDIDSMNMLVQSIVLKMLQIPEDELPQLMMDGSIPLLGGGGIDKKQIYLSALNQIMHQNIQAAGQSAVLLWQQAVQEEAQEKVRTSLDNPVGDPV